MTSPTDPAPAPPPAENGGDLGSQTRGGRRQRLGHMTHGLRAFRWQDGTTAAVVEEEDARARNLVHRWQPNG